MPHLVFEALGEVRQGSYATWHVAAVATLLAIASVLTRRLFVLDWLLGDDLRCVVIESAADATDRQPEG